MFGFIAFLPRAEAVVPAPDGGYPGGNTAEGQSALLSLTTGGFNSAVGWLSLRSNTTGQFNTAIGAGALLANTTANQNTATGAGALFSNTIGIDNTATGAFALFSNTNGISNTATGGQALQSNTTGFDNTADGSAALQRNATGGGNTATGFAALVNNTTGSQNTAVGAHALFSNTTGNQNTVVGLDALSSNTTGSFNTANGAGALVNNTTGMGNTALGLVAGGNVTTANNVICIGAAGADVSNTCFIGNIRGVTTQNADAIPVLIDTAGQLGTVSSSRRFKTEIKSMDKASEALLALKPVTFHYKSDQTRTPQFGLVAEEVAEVNPNLVVRDESGEIYSVRYDAVNAMLLNEFLKEHQKNDEQQATIAQLKNEMASLTATVKDQAEQIQKVSLQVELSRSATKLVGDNQ